MKVIGIDPGLAITGYGVIGEDDKGTLTTFDYGVILSPSTDSQEIRLSYLYNQLIDLINLHQPDSSAVEKLFFQKNVSSAMSVGQARGVVLLALCQKKIPMGEYNPMEVKQAVCGYGKAQKIQIQQMVKMLLQLREIPKPDDAADALAIAICHLAQSRSFANKVHDDH